MRRFFLGSSIALLVLTLTHSIALSNNSITPTLDAIWHVQSFPFEYRSDTTFYNCDSLVKKVRAILKAVGAHHSVVETRCEGGPFNRISARIAVATPVPASEENVRAETTFDSKDQLVARLRSITLPTANDLERFPASWQKMSLAKAIRDVPLTLSDCDLLRGMNEQVFPRIAVRVNSRKLNCGIYSNNVRPNIEVEALVAALPSTPVAQVLRP
ncbi:MAG: hypothetical protein ACJ8MR_10925 [Povalibacter sp.]|jgi:hypothetical protein